jgi:hypothetical protein
MYITLIWPPPSRARTPTFPFRRVFFSLPAVVCVFRVSSRACDRLGSCFHLTALIAVARCTKHLSRVHRRPPISAAARRLCRVGPQGRGLHRHALETHPYPQRGDSSQGDPPSVEVPVM